MTSTCLGSPGTELSFGINQPVSRITDPDDNSNRKKTVKIDGPLRNMSNIQFLLQALVLHKGDRERRLD